MKNWKVILQSNTFFFLLFFFLFCYCLFFFLNTKKSQYREEETFFQGVILDYTIDGDSLKLTMTGKEKLQAFYTIKTEQEKSELEQNLGYGKKVSLVGNLEVPSENVLPYTFNYKDYLYYNHIHYILNISQITITASENLFYQIKNDIYARLKKFPNSEYFLAFLLGNTKEYDLTNVRANGISHLFAVSGMHISLFVAVLGKIVLKRKKLGQVLLSIFLLVYGFLVAFSPSVLRVLIIYFLNLLNRKVGSPLSSKKIFFFCFFFLIVLDPFYLKNIGFQYSFLISFAFFYVKKETSYLKNLWKTSLIAFFISLPITAINFYEVNFLGIILNLIFVPFVSFLLYPFCFVVLIFPFLSPIYGWMLLGFELLNTMFSKVTFFTIVIPQVSVILWLVYYVFFYGLLKTEKRTYYCFLLLLFCVIKMKPYLLSSASVYFLDVGQGDCTLFISPHQAEVILIDTGGAITYQKEPWQERKQTMKQANTLLTFFRALGLTKLDHLVLTHGDMDHLGNAFVLLESIKVQYIHLNRNEEKMAEKVIEQKYTEKIRTTLDSNFFGIEEYTITTEDENDSSLIYRIKVFQTSFLMMGDASKKIENQILAKMKHSDIIKLGHHGSKTSSGLAFLKKVNPTYAIISAGKNNRYGHPNEETIESLNQLSIPYYETSVVHTMYFQITKDQINFKPLSMIS